MRTPPSSTPEMRYVYEELSALEQKNKELELRIAELENSVKALLAQSGTVA